MNTMLDRCRASNGVGGVSVTVTQPNVTNQLVSTINATIRISSQRLISNAKGYCDAEPHDTAARIDT